MSQALAICDQHPGGALAGAFKGGLAQVEYDVSALAEVEEQPDLHGIENQVPRLNCNAKEGRFHEPGLDKAGVAASPNSITGVILSRAEAAVHFTPKDSRAGLARELGYGALLSADKWICRNANLVAPRSAELNTSLTPEQRQAALKFGIGGATGKGCQGCPGASWHPYDGQNLRLCTQTENFVWLDSQIPFPVVLQVQAAASVGELRRWLSSTFRRGGKVLSLCSFVVKFSWKSETTPSGKEIWVLRPEIVSAVTAEQMQALRAIRQDNLYLLERAARAQDSDPVERDDAALSPPPTDADYERAMDDALGGDL